MNKEITIEDALETVNEYERTYGFGFASKNTSVGVELRYFYAKGFVDGYLARAGEEEVKE